MHVNIEEECSSWLPAYFFLQTAQQISYLFINEIEMSESNFSLLNEWIDSKNDKIRMHKRLDKSKHIKRETSDKQFPCLST
jgi:hypothetical protein